MTEVAQAVARHRGQQEKPVYLQERLLEATAEAPWASKRYRAIKRCPMKTCKNTSWESLCIHRSKQWPKAGNRLRDATSRQPVHTRAGRVGKAKSQMLSLPALSRVARYQADTVIMQGHVG